MEAVIDQAGRIVLPKAIRDALGLLPGTKVDISPYGAGVQIVPAGRTARLVEEKNPDAATRERLQRDIEAAFAAVAADGAVRLPGTIFLVSARRPPA